MDGLKRGFKVGCMNNRSSMKPRLINSMLQSSKALSNADRMKLGKIIDKLKNENVIIPNSDYENVITFVLTVAQDIPDIMNDHPDNQPLIDLFKKCLQHLNMIAELKGTSKKR